MQESKDSSLHSNFPENKNHQGLNQGLIFEEKYPRKPLCNVCLREMNDPIYRMVIFQDKENNPILKNFHFFFPCWDLEFICQKYSDYKITKLGFSCEKSILKNYNKVRNLQRNLSMWI